ncbi:MAG TPA: DNA ligase, partial [archaeon]|nr:DNA ligase [archaeon]
RWLSSVILAAWKGNKLVATGRMASGFTEEQLETLTKTLKPLIIKEEGKIVAVKPVVVIEIGYEEIQRSPKYESGYALRFPRLLRLRTEEKKPEDADTVATIEKLFKMQRGRK